MTLTTQSAGSEPENKKPAVAKPVAGFAPAAGQQQALVGARIESISTKPSILRSTNIPHLQGTLGNRRVAQLLAQRQPAAAQTKGERPASATSGMVLQRLLDDTKYSPAALKEEGLKPGFRMFGKTSFGKLVAALGRYFAATTEPEQYTTLRDVMAAATAYAESDTREKQHTGKKAVRETNKQSLVDDLVVDAALEMQRLKENSGAELLAQLTTEDSEATFMMLASKLATEMGVSLDDLRAMSVDELKSTYLEQVFLEVTMKTRAGQDAGSKGQLVAQLDRSFTATSMVNIDINAFDDGPNKDLCTRVIASQIGSRQAMGSSKAPKFMTGGSTDAMFQPEMEGWSPQKQIKISGNDDFRQKIEALIDVIKGVEVGNLMLQGLGAPDEVADGEVAHPDNKKTVVSIAPPSVSSANRKDDATGQFMYASSAGASSVVSDPDNAFVGDSLDKGQAEPWRIRDAAIGLFHEMIHAYLHINSGEEFASREDPEVKLKPGAQGGLAEVRITGVPYEKKQNGNTYTFPFDDPDYNYISENTFRREFAAKKGLEEVYLRPSYGTEAGQKPLGLGAVPT